MLTLVPKEIEQYARDHSSPEPELLAELTRVTHEKSKIPQMLIGPLEGNLLAMLIKISGARTVLEIGTFTGYSALYMASALPEDGRVYTCDINPETTKIAQEFWDRSPHGKKIELLLGPALQTIPTVDTSLDLVFIDADKTNYSAYWELVVPMLRRGGLVVADNVLWSGRVLAPEDDSDRALVAFVQHVDGDDRVERVLLTIRDGILVCRKK